MSLVASNGSKGNKDNSHGKSTDNKNPHSLQIASADCKKLNIYILRQYWTDRLTAEEIGAAPVHIVRIEVQVVRAGVMGTK